MNKRIRMPLFKRIFLTITLAALLGVAPLVQTGWAGGDYSSRQELIDKATWVVKHVLADPNMGWARTHMQQAEALIIFPNRIKGAFVIGASGGSGVALARDKKTGEWSYPAFYTMGSFSLGLQIGGKVSEVIMMVMTQKGLDALMTTSFKLGGDVGIAAGPVGTGAEGKLTDILSFVLSKGAFAGVSLEGSVITARDGWNQTYYGKSVSPSDIFIRRTVKNSKADALRLTVSRIKR